MPTNPVQCGPNCKVCKPIPTNEQMMQAVVEAADEKWHRQDGDKPWCICAEPASHKSRWQNCKNPSHTDLNALFGYARKLGYRVKIVCYSDGVYVALAGENDTIDTVDWLTGQHGDYAEALLHALYKAVTE